MTPKHLSKLAQRSSRIDLYPQAPSVVFSVPPGHRLDDCVNEIVRVDVDRVAVPFVHLDRLTAQLATEPPEGSMVSLYFVHPAEHSTRVLDYLHKQDTEEEHRARLMRLSRPLGLPGPRGPQSNSTNRESLSEPFKGHQATALAGHDGYGLQRAIDAPRRVP